MLCNFKDNCEWISSTVPKNGFNPSWGETATFKIKYPELALLEFKVNTNVLFKDDIACSIHFYRLSNSGHLSELHHPYVIFFINV